MGASPDVEDLLNRMRAMSPSDILALEGAVNAPEGDTASMATAAGSQNDALWKDMVQLGWLIQKPDLPLPGVVPTKVFSITPAGVKPIRDLLAALRRRKKDVADKMVGIYRELCVPFVNQLKFRTRDAGGDLHDIAMLSGMTLGGILKLCFSANEHEKALESIDHFARNASKQGHSLEPGPNSKTTSPQSGERRSTTLGLANFLGPGANTLLHSDCQTLAPLFGANLIGTDASVPRCTVLFTYCNLDPTGTLSGTTLGVTDLAASSGAQLVILASPNAPETVVNPTFVHALAGKNVPAPLVITFDRRGEAFSKFFLDLFLRMKAGARMFRAWVDIAPQEPNFVHQGPAIMCVDGPSQMNKPTPQPPRNFTPLTDFLRHSFPGLTEAQAAMLAASRMDSRPGSKTWQALFDEMVAKSADAPGARQVYFQGQLQSGEKTIPVSAIALEFARISHGAFVTIFDTEIGRGVGAIDFSRYDEALKETLRRIGYRRA